MLNFNTPDLCDEYGDTLQVAKPIFTNYGRRKRFFGSIITVKCFEDNVKFVETLETAKGGSVLVVDGGGSLDVALMGDKVTRIAMRQLVAAVIINGAVRDSKEIGNFDVAVLALAPCPKRSRKEGQGEVNVPVEFAGVSWTPGHYVYGDEDGIILSETALG